MIKTVNDFSASYLGQVALQEFVLNGASKTAYQLVFTAIEKEPYQAEALHAFSQILERDQDALASAIVLEYILSVNSPIPQENRNHADNLRFFFKWRWGFSTHESGHDTLPEIEFLNREKFLVDDASYWTFLSPLLNASGSIENAFQVIHKTNGRRLGFLQPPQDNLANQPPFHFDALTEEWFQWLDQPSEQLEKIDQAFRLHQQELRAKKTEKLLAQNKVLAQKAYQSESSFLNFLALLNVLGGIILIFLEADEFSDIAYNLFFIFAGIYFMVGTFIRKGTTWLHPIAIILMMLQGMTLVTVSATGDSNTIFWLVSILVAVIWLIRFRNLDIFSFKQRQKSGYQERSWFGVGLVLYMFVFLVALLLRYS